MGGFNFGNIAKAIAGRSTPTKTSGTTSVSGTTSAPKAPISVSGTTNVIGSPAKSVASSFQPVRSSAPAPSYSYSPNVNQSAANNVVYWKQMYDQAAAAGKPKDSLNYISKQAQGAYGQLDPTTARRRTTLLHWIVALSKASLN